eukprot:12974600-Alexandrium_andersonii.AAC.1
MPPPPDPQKARPRGTILFEGGRGVRGYPPERKRGKLPDPARNCWQRRAAQVYICCSALIAGRAQLLWE